MINCWSDCWSRFTCYIINKLYVLQAKQRIIRTHPLLVINFIKSIYSSYDYSHAIDRSLGQFLSPSICTSDPRPAVITPSENLQPHEALQRVIILAKYFLSHRSNRHPSRILSKHPPLPLKNWRRLWCFLQREFHLLFFLRAATWCRCAVLPHLYVSDRFYHSSSAECYQ